MKNTKVAIILFAWIFLLLSQNGCSLTIGTINVNDDGMPNAQSEIVQTKPVTVTTDAKIPISAVP